MRAWHLTGADPMAPRISADARSGRTTYTDDQTWQLRLGQPDEAAVGLETRYGGRVGLARVVPVWIIGRRQVFEAQGYHSPPVLTAFTPDYLRVTARVTYSLGVTFEFWAMESQAVGGRITVEYSGEEAETVRLDLTAQALREQQPMQMYFLTLENDQVALQMGRLPFLQPVLMMEGAGEVATRARLSRTLALEPGATVVTRWVLASTPDRDASLGLAYKWLAEPVWDAYLIEVRERAEAAPQIETGDPDWDATLAWSQQMILRGFLAATSHLPHPSFVSARKIAQGYPAGGQHAGGFGAPWGGQTVTEALHIAAAVAQAAPELAKGVVRNFLAVQQADGWIDARPGLGGQRAGVLAPPLLATLAYTVYHYTGDADFLAECFDGLVAFFRRWFRPDVDHNNDGVPEWAAPGQGAFDDSPTFAQGRRWAQGVDIATVQAPDLTAYLLREAAMLLRIARQLGREDAVQDVAERQAALQAALNEMWDAERGVFHYRDRDSYACPAGEEIFQIKGDQPLDERTELPHPSRLILRVTGGLSRKPKMSCAIEGVGADGQMTHETLDSDAFSWYRGSGTATTRTVWQAITYLKFDGVSRVFKIDGRTVDLSRHDQALLMPLWSGALSEEQVERTLALLTDPAQYWADYGARGCPQSDPDYDPQHRNGCGGMWPEWNARLGWALIGLGRRQEAAALFERVLAAQVQNLKASGVFRAFYDPETGEGLGDADVLSGMVALGWFGRLFGAYVRNEATAVIADPFGFAGRSMRWTQHGVIIERSDDGTTITFPSGGTVELPPDAEPGAVRDPKGGRRKPPKAPAPEPAPPPDNVTPPPVRPDEGLLPDGT